MNGLIIVVNFNQEHEIGGFLDRLGDSNPGLDVVLVDDGSTDGSLAIAEQSGYPLLRHSRNRGIGAAIRTGIRYGQEKGHDFVVIMSSNGKMRPSEIQRVVAPILDGSADYVQGSRFLAGGESIDLNGFRRLAIPAYSLMTSALLQRRFSDITCGFRAYKLSLFDDPRMDIDQPWLDRYELEYYVHYWAVKLGARTVEVPITIDYSHLDKGRRSKIIPIIDWWPIVRPFVYLSLRVKR